MSLALLQELRTRLGIQESQRESLPCQAFPPGLPRGALVELTGPGKTESVASLLAEHPSLRVAWVESPFSIFPSALLQRNVNLEKIFFIEGGRESAWAAAALLRSQLFPLLVYHAPYGEERELRRFQLLAEKAASTMLLLGNKPSLHSWPIRLSLSVQGRRLVSVKGK